MDELQDKLSAILSNPQMMQQIMSLANSMGGSPPQQSPEPPPASPEFDPGMLKKISSMARADCEKFMGTRVYLTTWVKVKENWRDSDFLVRNFGYSE